MVGVDNFMGGWLIGEYLSVCGCWWLVFMGEICMFELIECYWGLCVVVVGVGLVVLV